jgi:predicted nucleic acid-binding Zn ribbon protein
VLLIKEKMKRADEVLSAFFDERLMKKAHGYSKLFASWAELTEKNGIAAAAAHSRIRELDRGILQIEADHPGWIQILQTKESKLLNDFQRRFPEQDISGMSLMLSRPGPPPKDPAKEQTYPYQNHEVSSPMK